MWLVCMLLLYIGLETKGRVNLILTQAICQNPIGSNSSHSVNKTLGKLGPAIISIPVDLMVVELSLIKMSWVVFLDETML